MNRSLVLLGSVVVASFVGCAGNQIITATGVAPLDAYKDRDRSPTQVALLATRAALVAAQRNLFEQYAGTFLSSETEIRDFVTESDRIRSRSGGLLRGVQVVSAEPNAAQTAMVVTVRVRESDLEAALKQRW